MRPAPWLRWERLSRGAPVLAGAALALLCLGCGGGEEIQLALAKDSLSEVPYWRLVRTKVTLNAVVGREDCSEAWAVGNWGTVLHYTESSGWKMDSDASAWAAEPLQVLRMLNDGSVVALAPRAALHLDSSGSSWKLDETFRHHGEKALWLAADGQEAWWRGFGKLYHWETGTLQEPDPSNGEILGVWFPAAGDPGWAVGREGRILRYTGEWTETAKASNDLYAVALNPNGTFGLAVGDEIAARYDGKDWTSEALPNVVLNAIWVHPMEPAGWAVGDGGGIWRHDGARWTKDAFQDGESRDLQAVWLNGAGRCGWAVGQGAAILGWNGSTWTPQEASEKVRRSPEVCGKEWRGDGESSPEWRFVQRGQFEWKPREEWIPNRGLGNLCPECLLCEPDAQGSLVAWDPKTETELRYTPIPIPAAILEPVPGPGAKKSFTLRLDATSEPKLRIQNPRLRQMILGEVETLEANAASDPLYGIRIPWLADWFLALALEVDFRLQGAEETVPATFSRPAPLGELTAVQKGLLVGGGVLAANLLLFVLAVYLQPVRRWMLWAIGLDIKGVKVGMVLFFPGLLVLLRPIRLALFRDYRRQLKTLVQSPEPYIPVSLKLPAEGNPGESTEFSWQEALAEIVRRPKPRLWLLVGDSGLGKSRLLEEWAALALSQGQTPILLRLGELDDSPEKLARQQMATVGAIRVKPEMAFELLYSGGLLLFLDGLNETPRWNAVRDFVGELAHRNVVVLTSQENPGWRDIAIYEPELLQFGETQFRRLLGDAWAEKLLASGRAEEYRLPVDARLLADFLQDHDALPAYALDIYERLAKEETPFTAEKIFHLEEAAWNCARGNRKELEFEAVERLGSPFLNEARSRGIFTRRKESEKAPLKHIFVHDRIRSYFCARYIDRRLQELATVAEETRPTVETARWVDPLDMVGEIRGRRAVEDPAAAGAYLEFLKEVAAEGWGGAVRKRLYEDYDALCHRGVIQRDEVVERWAKGEGTRKRPRKGKA